MCGILFSTCPDVSHDAFRRALLLMRHRGPDLPGAVASFGAAQLGHNRLSIVDLDPRSSQPFVSSDARYVTVFNGEIYNFRELAARYGLQLRTTSDTEVLIELFRLKGRAMLDELIGMFAFVILDTLSGEYFAARDRLGVKPLYVFRDQTGVIMASELAAILHLRPQLKVDEFAVRQFRKMRGFYNGRTLYRGIEMFPAAHYESGGKVVRYWDLPEGPQAAPSDEELRELFTSAVLYRCIADVPVGSYLSGGLDSSIVAAVAPVTHTWSVGMPTGNEFEWARLVANRIGRTHHERVVTAKEFLEVARQMVSTRREPLSVPNEVLLYLMTVDVKRENTVILSGEGADELFAGYDRIFRWAASAPAWDIREFTRLYAYGSVDDVEVVEDAVAPFLKRGGAYEIVSAFFQVSHLHGLLRRLDNSTMMCGVEGRVPFVDHRLVERMAGVSFAQKCEDGVVKSQLKRAFRDRLPAEVIARPKVGFPVPLAELMPADIPGATPNDRWFNFNLGILGIS